MPRPPTSPPARPRRGSAVVDATYPLSPPYTRTHTHDTPLGAPRPLHRPVRARIRTRVDPGYMRARSPSTPTCTANREGMDPHTSTPLTTSAYTLIRPRFALASPLCGGPRRARHACTPRPRTTCRAQRCYIHVTARGGALASMAYAHACQSPQTCRAREWKSRSAVSGGGGGSQANERINSAH